MPNFQPNFIYSPLYGSRYLGGSRAHSPSTGKAGEVENASVQRSSTVGGPAYVSSDVTQGQPVGWSGTGRDQSGVSSLGNFGFVPIDTANSFLNQEALEAPEFQEQETDSYFDVPTIDTTGSFQVPTTATQDIPAISFSSDNDDSDYHDNLEKNYGQGIVDPDGYESQLFNFLSDYGQNPFAPGSMVTNFLSDQFFDSQEKALEEADDKFLNAPRGVKAVGDQFGNVTYEWDRSIYPEGKEPNMNPNEFGDFLDNVRDQGGVVTGLDASGNINYIDSKGNQRRSQSTGSSANFNLGKTTRDLNNINVSFTQEERAVQEDKDQEDSGSGRDSYSGMSAEDQSNQDKEDQDEREDGGFNREDGPDGWGADGWSKGGYIPASQSITQGMSMGNVTKFTQKDRYGNMLSIEFDVPEQMEIPHPGHPMGTDTVPAWLTPGERVMNAEAERMYGPILEDMNDQGRALQAAQGGTIPEYAEEGMKITRKPSALDYEQDKINNMFKSAIESYPLQAASYIMDILSGGGTIDENNVPYWFTDQLLEMPVDQYESKRYNKGGVVYAQEGLSPEQMSELLANQVVSGALDPRVAENALVNMGMSRGQAKAVTPSYVPSRAPDLGIPFVPSEVDDGMSSAAPAVVPVKEVPDTIEGGISYPEVPTTPGTLNAEPPQKVDDRMLSLRELLVKQEDIRNKPYKDTEGNWTVGIGHKITDKEVIKQLDKGTMPINYDDNQVMGLFDKDIETAMKGAKTNFSGFDSYSTGLQDALVSMNFQLGTEGTRKFKDFRSALAKGDYKTAKAELDNSDWAKQTPSRVEYLKDMIDQEASGRVGNKNTITSTSGQPVVDSRFGVESTYNPEQSQSAEVPPVGEDLSIPQQFRQFVFGDKRSLIDRWDSDMTVPQNVRNFVTGDPRALQDRNSELGFVGDEINYLNEAPQRPTGYGPSKEKEEWDKRYGLTHYENGKPKNPNLTSESFGDEVQEGLTSVAPDKSLPSVEGGRGNIIEKPEAREKESSPAKPKTPAVTDEKKSEAAQSLITKGEEGGEPTQDSKEVESNSTKATPEQKSEAKSFFDEWGLSDLFDKKEIGKMMALYLGSRALGYSHNGSLNFAAKNYVTSVQKKALSASAAKAEREKAVRTMIADGKITPKAGAAYVKTGNLAYLDAGSGKGISTGDFKTYYKNGKQYRAEKIKFPNKTEAWVLGNGDVIDHTYHEDAWRVPNTKEYRDARAKFVKDNRATFESVIKNAKGEEENVSWTKAMKSITPDKAARDFWAWAASTGRDPDSDATLQIRDSAFRQLIEDAKKEKFDITSLEPYLESELYRESSGRPDLFMVNLEAVNENKASPKYVDQDKMNELFAKIDRIAKMSGRYEGKAPVTIRQEMFNLAVTEWGKEENKQIVDIYKDADTPDEGTTGFYKFVHYLLDVQQKKLSQNTQ